MTATAKIASPPQLSHELSPRRCRAYEQLAMAVVKRTASQYAQHIRSEASQRCPDEQAWKLLKKRENIRIYKSREKFQPNLFVESSPSQPSPVVQWAPHSKLLCVGTLNGSLEDAMLGTVTPTEFAMASRSMAIKDEFIQHRVLQDIRRSTTDEPFEYVGLKWALRASALRSIVRPRDLVFVEASGFQYVPLNGSHERIGYTLCHSVDIPELQETTTKGVVRARFSMCSVYRQKAPGVVDVFVTLMSDPSGNVRPKLAAQSAAGALIAASRIMDCSLERKLAWLLKTNYAAAVSPDGACVAVAKVQGTHWGCLRCTRQLSSFSSLSSCGVCQSAVCGRCVTTRKLVVGSTPRDAFVQPVLVCTGCTATALRGVDTNQIAAEEFVPLPVMPRRKLTDCKERATASPTHRAESPSRAPLSPPIVLYEEEKTEKRPRERKLVNLRSTKPLELSDLETTEDEPTESEGDEDPIEVVEPLSFEEAERLRLLEQMNELRHQAEQTFRMTKRQTRTLQRSKLRDARFARRALSKSAIY